MKIVIFIFTILASNQALAQECIEPVAPLPTMYEDEEMKEFMRQDYRFYFDDVERYLNCINQSGGRVRKDALQAAQDFDRLLNQIPSSQQNYSSGFSLYAGPLTQSGTLFLDPKPDLHGE